MRSKTCWRWLRLLVGAGILGALGLRLGTGPFLDAIDVVTGPVLAGAVGIGILTTVCSAWRWSLIARGLGMDLPMKPAVRAYYRSLFLNAVLPGGVVGDVHRALRHGQDVGDVGVAARAVVLERTAGQVVLLAATAIILPAGVVPAGVVPADALPRFGTAPAWVTVAAILAVVGVLVAAILAMLRILMAGVEGVAGGAVRRPSRLTGPLHTWWRDTRRSLASPQRNAAIVATSAVVLTGHVATFVVAARAAGVRAPVGALAPLFLIALLAMSLPLNVAGWGPREGAAAWAFAAAGFDADLGLTVSVVYGLLALAAGLPGAAVLVAGATEPYWRDAVGAQD